MECRSETQFWGPIHFPANHHAATYAEPKPTQPQKKK